MQVYLYMLIQPYHIVRATALAQAFGVTRLLLFGSSLENLSTANDLDLAVEGLPDKRFFALAAQLEEELHISVDLVPLDPPTPFSTYIERRAKVLYDHRTTP
jgi:predicted nucleotidyltransferase